MFQQNNTPFAPSQPQQSLVAQDPGRILLDFSTPFDQNKAQALTMVVQAMYSGKNPADMQYANRVLNELKGNENAWMVADKILESCQDNNVKFFALQVLDDAIKSRWNIIDANNRVSMRNYMIQLVLSTPDQIAGQNNAASLLTKMNSTLISMVKLEWSNSWQNFIPDICSSAGESVNKCENALNILRLLSEEVFDFSKGTILKSEMTQFKAQMNEQFSQVFQLCMNVLTQEMGGNIPDSLFKACLRTLQAFLSWIPNIYIFNYGLVEGLISKFIAPAQTRVDAIKCITEVSALTFDDIDDPNERRQMKEKLCFYYCTMLQQVFQTTKGRSLLQEFQSVQNTKQQTGFETFAKQLALAISSVLRNNLDFIEQLTNTIEANNEIQMLRDQTLQGLVYLTQMSRIQDEELFKICLDFWHFFSQDIMNKQRQHSMNFAGSQIPGLNLPVQQPQAPSLMHAHIYPQILSEVKHIMFDLMAKPNEVLLSIDDNGEVEEEYQIDTENVALYEMMRETLIFLANSNTDEMIQIVNKRLELMQQAGRDNSINFEVLNKLCWALGSISGCMTVEKENQFLCAVIKELLNLCEKSQTKNTKAFIAADIMYVVGQFPGFLINHWAFLKTVMNKLHEFMHESHPGVQDMASETYLKIAKLTKQMFVRVNDRDGEPFINQIIRNLPTNLKDLETNQQLLVYESIGWMVSEEQDPNQQDIYINNLLSYSHQEFQAQLNNANVNINELFQHQNIKAIDHFVKINQRVADSTGFVYLNYLKNIFQDLLKIYNLYSQQISDAVVRNQAQTNPMVKPMKAVRRDILKLIQTYILKEKDKNFTVFYQQFLPSLKLLIDDYKVAAQDARDPEVLLLFSTMIKHMGESLTAELPIIYEGLCASTLSVIQSEFQLYPDFRSGFFTLVMNIIKHCTQGLFNLEQQVFQNVIHIVIFAMQHEKPELMDLGLQSMHALIIILKDVPQMATDFYKIMYAQILRETLAVMIDYRHVSGFKMQAMIIQELLSAADNDKVINPQVKLNNEQGQPHNLATNKDFVCDYLANHLVAQFQNMNKIQIEGFVLKLFNTLSDWSAFKDTLRDLLISMKSYASQNDDFYTEEKTAALEEQKRRDLENKKAIPGMIAPGSVDYQQPAQAGGNGFGQALANNNNGFGMGQQ